MVVTARTEEPHPRIEGTIRQTLDEIHEAGGNAIAVRCDVGVEEDIERLLETTIKEFGGIDIVVHNAAARIPGGVVDLPTRRWDLLWNINVRPLFVMAKGAVPSMQERGGGHILNISPRLRLPPTLDNPEGDPSARSGGDLVSGLPKQWASELALAMAHELLPHHIAVNCMWPGGNRNTEGMRLAMRVERWGHTSPALFADAALAIVTKDPATFTGHFVDDEDVLRQEGVTDFRQYLETSDATEPDM